MCVCVCVSVRVSVCMCTLLLFVCLLDCSFRFAVLNSISPHFLHQAYTLKYDVNSETSICDFDEMCFILVMCTDHVS